MAGPSFNTEAIKANVSQFKFEFMRLHDILTADSFPEAAAKSWVDDHFYLTIQMSMLYVVVVFGLKFFMRKRQPFDLFIPLNIWNFLLSVFSIMGTIKLSSEFIGTLSNKGFVSSYCKIHDFTSGDNGFWVYLFILSKLVELVDTVFLVLRKRPLMFLHWYHHVLTMIYAFYSYPVSPGFNRWGIYLNFFVHAFMYSYYFLRSMKIRVPGFVAQLITTLQILQFVISVVILAHLGFLIYIQKVSCDFAPRIFVLASFMDITYLILFINFFLKSYVIGGGKSKYQSGKKQKSN
uniref:Elongation of very long chain fatty acids protein n=2 Tax=Panagrolaimus sp. JU765 TaxID=591449 RepID=A0AC34QJZ5_9BILA